jgi:hypothetical protein
MARIARYPAQVISHKVILCRNVNEIGGETVSAEAVAGAVT